MKYILAIDQGTTGTRAIIYDKSGHAVARAYREFPQYFPHPAWVEHDPRQIWESTRAVIQSALAWVPAGSIASIGITNQRETTVIWDRYTGMPVYNAIVWQCRRTAGRCAELKKDRALVKAIRAKTGLALDAYFSATKIEWLLRHVKGVARRAARGELMFGTTDSWLLWNLSGGAVHATDYTNASRTMLFNIRSLEWDRELLRKFAVPASLLPQVKPSSGIFGTTVKVGRLAAGIPISGCAGDQQAALFGQTCFEAASMKNTYGTGSFILLNTGQKCVSSRHGLITTLGCGTTEKPVYVLEGPVFISGAAMQWLRDGLKVIRCAAESEAAAMRAATTSGVYFVPAFVGLGAPYWDPDARGSITGITRGTTADQIVRAGLEAMCYQTKDVVEAMEKDSGLRIKDLKVDGGAAANNFLCQFQADILGVPIVRPQVIETTSLGAAYLAGCAVGYWRGAPEVKRYWKVQKVFSPRMAPARMKALYNGWKDAVSRVLSQRKNP